jgi:hypothetical protein
MKPAIHVHFKDNVESPSRASLWGFPPTFKHARTVERGVVCTSKNVESPSRASLGVYTANLQTCSHR